MTPRVPDFRDETVKDTATLRLRLNQLVKRANDTSARFKAVRLPSVMAGQSVQLQNPGFNVVAMVLGGVMPIDGGAAPIAAPWVAWFTQGDGTISVTVNGLASKPAKYAVNLVMFEGEATL